MNVARYSPNGRYVAGASGTDNFLKLYGFNSETLEVQELATGDFHIHPINDISWSPCSRFIATGGEDCVVVIWRIHRNKSTNWIHLQPRRVLRGHVAAVTSVAFNPRGNLLASGGVDEKIIVWNVKGGTLFKLLNAHSRPVVSVDFSYDNKLLLTASYDGYLRVWSLLDGMALRILTGAEELMPICSAIFSPNSVYALVTHTDGVTRLINLASKKVVKKYGEEGNLHSNALTNNKQVEQSSFADLYSRELAFCHPNNILVGRSNGVVVYDIKTQAEVGRLTDAPALCIDVNEKLNVGLCAGPRGLIIFRLNFT